MIRLLTTVALALILGVASPTLGEEQSLDSRWEVSLDGRLGVPNGYLRVGEAPLRGTRLRLRQDLGMDVSEAVEASLAFRLTPRDAVRATYLYYFLEGGARFDQTISYNGDGFGPGHVHSNADFYRVSLDYDRLLTGQYGGFLTGTVNSRDRKSTRLNSSHANISYAVFCLKKKKKHIII